MIAMQVREGFEGAVRLKRWRASHELTRREAAGELGISERMLAYYETGERPVPRAIRLAVQALAAGLEEDSGEQGLTRERWVALVKNITDYRKGAPVVGRMLRQRDVQGLRDFLSFVRRGPDPALALTDPALFIAMREAATKAHLAGLSRYRVNETQERRSPKRRAANPPGLSSPTSAAATPRPPRTPHPAPSAPSPATRRA